MGHKKLSFTTRFVIAFGVLLVSANIILGIVILRQSETAMKSLINKNMLDIVNTAAGFLDGDALGALTEDDVGGDAFTDALQKPYPRFSGPITRSASAGMNSPW